MKEPLPIADHRWPVARRGNPDQAAEPRASAAQFCDPQPLCRAQRPVRVAAGFSLVELMITMTLLSLIVLALMAVFSSTQQAFRASVTQTDILEGSRAAVDLMTTDLRAMVPSDGAASNSLNAAVNFFEQPNTYELAYQPLQQSLPGTTTTRSNVLNYFFFLGRQNMTWTGIGYVVNATNSSPLYPLYRFYAQTNSSAPPYALYLAFLNAVYNAQWTNMSHVLDGVVQMTVRPYDVRGNWMTNQFQAEDGQIATNNNILFGPSYAGEVGCYMYSNMVPASVELQLGVLEDRTLQRAESLGHGAPPSLTTAQWSYLTNQSAHVYLFRQRVTIPNVDTSAYQ